MRKTRIGFVGLGSMGQSAHLKNYASLEECEVVAIAEIRPALGGKVAERYGVSNVYGSTDEMLASHKLDGIVASQPFDRRCRLSYHSIRPVFRSLRRSRWRLQWTRESVCLTHSGEVARHFLGYHKRSDPATIRAKREIDQLKETRAWEVASMPASADLPQALRQVVENEALRAVGAYRSSPTRLAFCQFSTPPY